MWYLCQKVSYDCTRGDASKFTVIHGRCPFEAIAIINLPTNLESQVTHRYTANAFKLHRLPTPRPGQVLGLVGTNGIGKSTALKILAGKLKPNLGRYDVCFGCSKLCPISVARPRHELTFVFGRTPQTGKRS